MKVSDFYEQVTAPVSELENIIEELTDLERDNVLTRAQSDALDIIKTHLQDAVQKAMDLPSDQPRNTK